MASKNKTPLSRERVLAAALAIVDEEGLDALSMRRLGQALNVEAMSLYRHVDGRGALLDGIHETILAELDDPGASPTWMEAVREYARAFRSVLIAHPHAIILFATRPAVTPASLDYVEKSLTVLRGAGFGVLAAVSAMQTVVTFVVGHVLSTHAVTPDDEQTSPPYFELAPKFPRIAEAAEVLAEHDKDDEFEFGLDAVVLGLAMKLHEGDDDDDDATRKASSTSAARAGTRSRSR